MSNDDCGKLIDIADGLEKKAKAGFAAMYRERDRAEAMKKERNRAEDQLAELAITIAYNECLQIIEPEGELVMQARKVIARLKLSASGQRALVKVLQARKAARDERAQAS